MLNDLKEIKGPKLLHIITTKGKGYRFAELNQTAWHYPGTFDKVTGEFLKIASDIPQPAKYQEVFGETLLELARQNKNIVAITPAMPTGSGLKILMDQLPEKIYDVGIAEQHAVTFSAGLATQGLIPYCNIYSSFMQRAYDQVIHDVAIQNLNVVLCLDRAGLVGDDGATHHGAFDLAFMRSIPNMIVAAPMDEIELRNMLYTAQVKNHGPFSIRYPRGQGVHSNWRKEFQEIPIGKGRMLSQGSDLAILSIGSVGNMVARAQEILAESNIHISHFDMRFVKPLDDVLLHLVFKQFKEIITIEDGVIQGGFGTAVLEFMSDKGYSARIHRMGIPDKFIEQGKTQELYNECGFDVAAIVQTAKLAVQKRVIHRAV